MKHTNISPASADQFQSLKYFQNFMDKCKELKILATHRQVRKLRQRAGLVYMGTGRRGI